MKRVYPAFALIALLLLAGLLAPWLAPYDPIAADLSRGFAPVSWAHPLGCDELGRDVLSRLIWGVRETVIPSVAATLALSAVAGAAGFVASVAGGRVERVFMRAVDFSLSVPSDVVMVAVLGLVGPGVMNLFAAVLIAKWPWYARMVALRVKEALACDAVRFARISGAGTGYVARAHIVRRLAGELAVFASLDAGGILLSVAALSFLGLGVEPPAPEWGVMLADAKNALSFHPEGLLAPGLAITLTILLFQYAGDALRSALEGDTHD